jgi:hypothetical protein
MLTSSTPAKHDSENKFLCECQRSMRSSCTRETFYKEHEGMRFCVLHYPGTEKKDAFMKAMQQKLHDMDFDFRGVWFPEDVNFQNFLFPTLATFSGALFNASVDFSGASFATIPEFSGTQFSANAFFFRTEFSLGANFNGARFGGYADFGRGRFGALTGFDGARFCQAAIFADTLFIMRASFKGTQFSTDVTPLSGRANFNGTEFYAYADFSGARFNESVLFSSAVFNASINFQKTRFINDNSRDTRAIKVGFDGVIFRDSVNFERNMFSESAFMSFSAAVFEKPERVTFHTTRLRPHWFINVDSRRFTFINVNWGSLDKRNAIDREIRALDTNTDWGGEDLNKSVAIQIETESLGSSGYKGFSHLLEIALRQLAVNAEENNRYEEAANFRYMAMDVRRLQRGRRLDLFRLSWWYWLLSGYGERVTKAFCMLITIWLVFAAFYWMGDSAWWQPKQSGRLPVETIERERPSPALARIQQPNPVSPLTLPESIIYSASVMSLQKPEPLPANKRAKSLVLFETILGPLQAALFALAVRRKFMR